MYSRNFFKPLINKIWIVFMVVFIIAKYSYGQIPEDSKTKQSNVEKFSTMSPFTLIQFWEKPKNALERYTIEEVILQKRITSLPILRDIIQKGTTRQKYLAISLVSEMRDIRSVQSLIAALDDRDKKVQVKAASALGKIGDANAIAPLRKKLNDSSSSRSLIKMILLSLARLGSIQDVPILRTYLSDSDAGIRVIAAEALAMLGNIEGQIVLLKGSRSTDPAIQREATYSLGYLNTDRAKNRILEIINDPNGNWKSYALIAQAKQNLHDKVPDEKLKILSDIMRDRNARLAGWAIEQIAEINSPEASKLLLSVSTEATKIGRKAKRSLIAK